MVVQLFEYNFLKLNGNKKELLPQKVSPDQIGSWSHPMRAFIGGIQIV